MLPCSIYVPQQGEKGKGRVRERLARPWGTGTVCHQPDPPTVATKPPGRLCRKFAFETICAMVSPGDLWCTERESDDGDQFQGSPLSAGDYSDGGAVVCRLPLELPACRRADAG